MNIATPGAWPVIEEADGLLMDVARRLQVTPSQHAEDEEHYRGVCGHVDREGSPLQGKVDECYAIGSGATGTAIVSKARTNKRDIDIAMELDVHPLTPPAEIQSQIFEATNGEPGSLYHGKVEAHSRCVTVHYDNRRSVDIMPIARLSGQPDRAAHLFHYDATTGEQYHKVINPWAFVQHFNKQVEFDPVFYDLYRGRQLMLESIKADTQPMPDHIPLEEKSARVVALQLLKRARDVSYRGRDHLRKPPSVVLAALALEAGPVQARLVDEVIAIANHIRSKLAAAMLEVFNPAYPPDEFTDRWPEDNQAQRLFDADLRRVIVGLYSLRNDSLSLPAKLEVLQRLFGETAARFAIEKQMDADRFQMEAGNLHIGGRGQVLRGASVAAAASIGTTAARAATREGGGYL